MLELFVARWGYLAICCGTFLEGETVLVTAGMLCHEGLLWTPLAAAAGCAGSVAWSQFWFWTGRRAGVAGLARYPSARATRLEPWMKRYASLFTLGFRFVAGIGTLAPALLGATRASPLRFTAFDIAGAALWTSAFGGIGWALAAGMRGFAEKASRISALLALALSLFLLSWLALRWLRRRSDAG